MHTNDFRTPWWVGPLALLLVLIGAGAGVMAAHVSTSGFTPASETVVQEDDPSWDCRTMGNRICGP